MKSNYHTHLVYCNHAIGHAEDYIKASLENNFIELGITDHAPILECFMTEEEYLHNWCQKHMTLDTMYQDYLPEVNAAKQKYKNQLKILTGLETEYIKSNVFFIKLLRSKVDYLNFGAHFFEYDNKYLNSYQDVDYKTIYGYLDTCIKGMESGLFNTLVHPDLFMFGYKNCDGKRIFDEHCEFVTRKICQTAIKENVYLEINANGIKNSARFSDGDDWLYPCYEFWKIASEYPKLKVIIGADAHDPKNLNDEDVKKTEKFASALGIKIEEFMEINH